MRRSCRISSATPADQYEKQWGPAGSMFVRVIGNAADYTDALRRRLQPLMPGASYVTVVTLQSLVDPTMVSRRFGATMFTAFGTLALVLAALGLYSVMAYGVAQRQQELSVRLALGATANQLMRLVVGDGVRTVARGLAPGGALSAWLGARIAGLLFAESPFDAVVYGAVIVVLIVSALLATAIPAMNAGRVDADVVLRGDRLSTGLVTHGSSREGQDRADRAARASSVRRARGPDPGRHRCHSEG